MARVEVSHTEQTKAGRRQSVSEWASYAIQGFCGQMGGERDLKPQSCKTKASCSQTKFLPTGKKMGQQFGGRGRQQGHFSHQVTQSWLVRVCGNTTPLCLIGCLFEPNLEEPATQEDWIVESRWTRAGAHRLATADVWRGVRVRS